MASISYMWISIKQLKEHIFPDFCTILKCVSFSMFLSTLYNFAHLQLCFWVFYLSQSKLNFLHLFGNSQFLINIFDEYLKGSVSKCI